MEEWWFKASRNEIKGQQVARGQINLYLEGTVRNEAELNHDINPFPQQKADMPRGVENWNCEVIWTTIGQQKNDRFDATASGLRWGATTYNPRFDNLGPAPIGFAWELASDSNIGQTRPQAISANYFQSIWVKDRNLSIEWGSPQ